MKIDRNDLRKIIFETLQKNLLREVNLNQIRRIAIQAAQDDAAIKKGNDKPEAVPLADNEKFQELKTKLEDLKEKTEGPFKKENSKRAKEAEDLLKFMKDLETNPETESHPTPESDDQQSSDVEAQERSVDQSWFSYLGDDVWEYKIEGNSPDEFWTTRKKGTNTPIYNLSNTKYASTVKKLDASDDLPNRSAESIKNDKAFKTPTSAKTSSEKQKVNLNTYTMSDSKSQRGTLTAILKYVNLSYDSFLQILNLAQDKLKSNGIGDRTETYLINGSRIFIPTEKDLSGKVTRLIIANITNGKFSSGNVNFPNSEVITNNSDLEKINSLLVKTSNESLSHGALIRQRYRRY
jgi:hypothetical protein